MPLLTPTLTTSLMPTLMSPLMPWLGHASLGISLLGPPNLAVVAATPPPSGVGSAAEQGLEQLRGSAPPESGSGDSSPPSGPKVQRPSSSAPPESAPENSAERPAASAPERTESPTPGPGPGAAPGPVPVNDPWAEPEEGEAQGGGDSSATSPSTSEPGQGGFALDPAANRAPPARVNRYERWGNTSTPEGPFYVSEPVSEVQPAQPVPKAPVLSVGKGTFCFVEDSVCRSSLLAYADVGVGTRVISSDDAPDLPYTQVRAGGGFTVRPIYLARGRWHPWGLGLYANGSLGSNAVIYVGEDDSVVERRGGTPAMRIGLVNQIWLANRRFAPHVDFGIGAIRSTIFADPRNRYWGTHVDASVGFGGWGALVLSGDFLDEDTRVTFGFRGHAIAAAPIAGLVILGLIAGGVNIAAQGSAGGS